MNFLACLGLLLSSQSALSFEWREEPKRVFFIAFLVLSALISLPLQAAEPVKTVRWSMLSAETTFDPAKATDLYSNTINEAIFDPLLTYDHLARPAKLIANTAVAMPEVTENGAVYTFKVRPGIYFADDPAFKGKKRELTAQDYAYAIRRLYDPQLKSGWLWYVEGKIAGGDAAMAAAKKTGKFDYDAPITGLETPDRYTLRVRLTQTDYNFLYVFATVQLGGIAREVVEANLVDPGAHPVGTGPFILKDWSRSSRMTLVANPNYREHYYEAQPTDEPASQKIYREMKGKKLPQIQRVEITVVEEAQPRWLTFLNGDTDYANAPNEFAGSAFPNGKLAPYLVKRGMVGERFVEMDLVYSYFNMDNPMLGGTQPSQIALRRAIWLAYNTEEEIMLVRNGGAVAAQSPIPPGVEGYDPKFINPSAQYNPAKANALLDLHGFTKRDTDGYRLKPDGSPLVLNMASEPTNIYKQFDELWKKCMDAVGIRYEVRKGRWPELNKESKAGKLSMWQLAWSGDYPDAENFLQNLYGGNIGSSNDARFKNAEFDKLYEAARKMPPSPERNKLYWEMNRILAVYVPWIPHTHRIRSEIWHPWVLGYTKHPIFNAPWLFMDIDESKRPK